MTRRASLFLQIFRRCGGVRRAAVNVGSQSLPVLALRRLRLHTDTRFSFRFRWCSACGNLVPRTACPLPKGKVTAPQAPTDEDSLLRCPPAPRHEEGEPRRQRDSPS